MRIEDALEECPLVAIIRGVRPAEVLDIADAVYSAGIRVVEVPLNSPEPLESIARLKAVGDRMAFGAGTVLRAGAVDAVAQAGGQIIIAPNTDVGVIRRSVERGLTPMPGFSSATEAFCAIEAGAKYLKLFPASTYGTDHLKALKDVLPPEVVVLPVGGVGPDEMADWWKAGARGFGLGGALYRAGSTAEDVHARAVQAVETVKALR